MCVNTQKYYMAYINAVYNTECNMVCSMQELFLNLIMQMQLDGVLSFTLQFVLCSLEMSHINMRKNCLRNI